MYACTILSMLVASTVLAAPNPMQLRGRQLKAARAQQEHDMSSSSRDYAALPRVSATSIVTVTATITEPEIETASTTSCTSQFTMPPVWLSTPTSTSSEVSASPSPSPKAKESAGVYICSDVFWGGECEHKFGPKGSSDEACTVLDGTASSIGPDKGFDCIFYTNSYCRQFNATDHVWLKAPGEPNLLVLEKGDYNDKFYSYQCFDQGVVESPS